MCGQITVYVTVTNQKEEKKSRFMELFLTFSTQLNVNVSLKFRILCFIQ